jgi:hypothetical protein
MSQIRKFPGGSEAMGFIRRWVETVLSDQACEPSKVGETSFSGLGWDSGSHT